MKVDRINKLKGYRVFQDFDWPADLANFSERNVIYGWNGSGKSTISNLFRAVEKRVNILEGEVEFQIDGKQVRGNQLSTAASLPQIRVFNRDFVVANISPDFERTTNHIFFLGEENVEKQEQAAEKRAELEQITKQHTQAERKVAAQAAANEEFATNAARQIKEVMTALGTSDYTNYTKRKLKESWATFKKLSDTDRLGKDLDAPTLERFRQECKATEKEKIDKLGIDYPEFSEYRQKLEALLKRTVSAGAIERLKMDAALSAWVRQGFEKYHRAAPDLCPYCEQTVAENFFDSLNAHFDDQFNQLMKDIDEFESQIAGDIDRLQNIQIPDKARLYEQLQTDFEICTKVVLEECECSVTYLRTLQQLLQNKRGRPFAVLDCEIETFSTAPSNFQRLNELIEEHNRVSANFSITVTNARRRIEESYACRYYQNFDDGEKRLADAQDLLRTAQSKMTEVKGEIEILESELISNRIPANELTNDLRHYLGRDELTVEVEDTGYRICRHGITASHLSDGERTAVTFLFFLKSLRDKDFDITKSVVVIDDPVSSLDSNALFFAFGYLKERTKDSGQLFVLTHNFTLFRQIKNWFTHLNRRKKKNKPKPAEFYSLSQGIHETKRTARLGIVDSLLLNYESEYHFLFKQVFDAAHEPTADSPLIHYYGLPNIARRMIETFLSHRFPDAGGDLINRFNRVGIEQEKKVRILRFLNTYSHSGGIVEPEHDLSILSEAKLVLGDVLDMIETIDPDHFNGMKVLMGDN